MNRYEEAMKELDEKLGRKDGLISLSTIALDKGADGKCRPAARIVDAFYQNGAFYTVTNAASAKMRQIEQNPEVAVCIVVENFTADGIGENLVKQVNDALEARELIKGRVLENSMYTAREAAEELKVAARCKMVQVIGSKFVLFRYQHNKDKRKIELEKDRKRSV